MPLPSRSRSPGLERLTKPTTSPGVVSDFPVLQFEAGQVTKQGSEIFVKQVAFVLGTDSLSRLRTLQKKGKHPGGCFLFLAPHPGGGAAKLGMGKFAFSPRSPTATGTVLFAEKFKTEAEARRDRSGILQELKKSAR